VQHTALQLTRPQEVLEVLRQPSPLQKRSQCGLLALSAIIRLDQLIHAPIFQPVGRFVATVVGIMAYMLSWLPLCSLRCFLMFRPVAVLRIAGLPGSLVAEDTLTATTYAIQLLQLQLRWVLLCAARS
jgi:hypothetical protein